MSGATRLAGRTFSLAAIPTFSTSASPALCLVTRCSWPGGSMVFNGVGAAFFCAVTALPLRGCPALPTLSANLSVAVAAGALSLCSGRPRFVAATDCTLGAILGI